MIRMQAGSLRAIDLGKKVAWLMEGAKFKRSTTIFSIEHRSAVSKDVPPSTYINGMRFPTDMMVEVGTEHPHRCDGCNHIYHGNDPCPTVVNIDGKETCECVGVADA